MTDMDAAELLLAHLQSIGADIHNGALPVIRRDIDAAIAAAVAAEREACALLADAKAEHYKKIEWFPAYGLDAFVAEDERIAAAIRARGNGGK